MATRFTEEEAREILERAIERDAEQGASIDSRQVVEIAAELEIPEQAVRAAIGEVMAERELQRELTVIREQRRRATWNRVSTWLMVNALLFFINWSSGPPWWFQWPLGIWGLYVALRLRGTLFPSEPRDRARAMRQTLRRQRQWERRQRRQRKRGVEQGIEQAIERGVGALIDAAARHVERVTSSQSVAAPAAGRDPASRAPGGAPAGWEPGGGAAGRQHGERGGRVAEPGWRVSEAEAVSHAEEVARDLEPSAGRAHRKE